MSGFDVVFLQEFENIDRMRREFNETKSKLQDLRSVYIKRRDTMRGQVQSVSSEHENLKKALQNNEIARELEDTEKRLKHYERAIFELKEFVDSKQVSDYIQRS
ncbi:hypothetical protein EON65_33865 [archaeon]|nr:MAG: hypothetical protein EON65_33865 [archaeon]